MDKHDTTLSTSFKGPNKHDAKHTEDGGEIGDPTPMQPPLGYKRTPSLAEQIAQQVRMQTIQRLEDEMDPETEEEADDFEIADDDGTPPAKYENDHVPTIAVLKKRAKEINDAIRKRNTEQAIENYKKSIKKPPSPAAQPPDNDLTLPPEKED